MEESSDSHMETDVSSTTQDIPPPQDPAGPSSSMEVTVEVAETTPADEEMQPEEQDERIDSNTPEKAPLNESVEQKVPVKVIVIKKAKNSATVADLERSLLKKDALKSPTKICLLKTAQASNNSVQALIPIKKTPEKAFAAATVLDRAVTLQTTPVKGPKAVKDVTPPKNPEKEMQVEKSPSKYVEALTVEPAEKVVGEEKKVPPKEVQTPSKVSETEEKVPASADSQIKVPAPVDSQNTSKVPANVDLLDTAQLQAPVSLQVNAKKNEPDQLSITELTAPMPEKEAEIVSQGEVTVTVSVEPHDEKGISDDSQSESISSVSNKSISRELKSLINSAKESKIISECTQVKTKTRKSRSLLDNSTTSLNTSTEPDKIQGRRESCNSQESSCSEKSEKAPQKPVLRVRSQNQESAPKNKGTTSTSKSHKEEQEGQVATEEKKVPENEKPHVSVTISKKVNSIKEDDQSKSNKLRSDPYCWRCHYAVDLAPNEKAHVPARCTVCPRAFHYRCLSVPERTKFDKETNWVCPKCMTILHAESSETRSPVMKNVTLGMLCDLLKYALKRMMEVNGVEPFLNPVDRATFPDYDKYVVHAVDLGLMKDSIAAGVYGSTEAFTSDAQWILHNSIIFNTPQSKLTAAAKSLVRSCRTEMSEIEACPECYAAAHARRPTWFTDVCSNPHVLLWAKLKGFPYWPAKGMSVNSGGMVDARFFGAHDRAWVPARDCFLYSERDPNAFRSKRQDIIDSMQEAEQHIRNISRKFGKFIYPAFKVPFEPAKINEQIKMMIPGYEPEAPVQKQKPPGTPSPAPANSPADAPKGRSTTKNKESKDPKDSVDGRRTDEDAPPAEKKRKTIDFIEVEVPSKVQSLNKEAAKEGKKKEDSEKKRAKSVEPEEPKKPKESPKVLLRKRRRSQWEEATMTVMTPEPAKRQKTATADTPDKSKLKPVENKAQESTEPAKGKETTEGIKTYGKTGTSSPKPTQVEAVKVTKEATSTTSPMVTRASTPASTSKQPNKPTPKVNTPKEADKVKKAKAAQRDKSTSSEKEKDDKPKPNRDRTSKGNNSQNSTPKSAKKKSDRENSSSTNDSDTCKDKIATATKGKGKSLKDVIVFDEDNTSLAVLSKKSVEPRLPTISNVRSLSQTDMTEANTNSSIFTPTSTDNVNNMKEAVAKLQKLRETDQPMVGRVGVRSFARMTSPPAQRDASDKDQVEVEVKAEPIDLDDADRQSEKIDFANTICLRPVNPQSMPSLRDIRITKTITTGASTSTTTTATVRKQIVVNRPTKARKTFPQPLKANELTSKNSMVYIPIQPPVTGAPVRPSIRVHASVNGPGTPPLLRPPIVTGSTSANNIVNTMTTPLMTVVTMSSSSTPMPTLTQVPNVGQLGTLATLGSMGQIPQVGQVPTTVHTVPLITSVNGQWTFSLQPMVSVGGVDRAPSPPLSNGMPEPPLPVSVASSTAPSVPPLATLAPKVNDTTSFETPRLQHRLHPLDPKAPVPEVTTPSAAGPLTTKLNQSAAKLTDFFRLMLEESLEYMEYITPAILTSLKRDMERLQWRHRQQIEEIKHNHELETAEMRAMFASEKMRAVTETRRAMHTELANAVKQAKSRQWCANCQQEAQFYCCWNTSYCDYPCQRAHWSQHYTTCTQQRSQDSGNVDSLDLTEDRLQPTDNPPALQKPTGSATITVGGKILQNRLVCQNSGNPIGNPAIYVRNNLVEDSCRSSIPTVKCVSTYKGAPQTTQSSPLLLNKQIMNSEENTPKKVVTSGGYLIVGAASAANPSLTIN